MRVSLIAAMDQDRVIGVDNALPWRLPGDLRRFRQLTLGKPVLMGRRTYESIGVPLPERENIVITHDEEYAAEGCRVVQSVDEALRLCEPHPEAMVIGGASLYRQTLPLAQRLYLTLVHHRFRGDTFFPVFESDAWSEVERRHFAPDARNPFPYTFLILERR
ncbi:MAG: type 3 dihydrofolate reductase [Gammaproteobacteria bacterium]|nr:type 3 dihydrofolate reductase [Gammaproteobacteria bacterium]NIR82005.1 type 3 dihydrofolate reductase [Gammaproteobacteria bacterium]NIR89065.1 type 3 dihydrofolate reductase [Gammaproteobacteria bacterium]NIU03112.1 type 3 dihydrofolate reductase [Gammaproteobacteria bacterium]NIX84387.1 type 3 dihydrofolate reductase [Gammaproteobacteria bacterium]